MNSQKHLSRKSIFGYALLAPSIAFAQLPLYLYIPKYYHVVFGLNLGTIGIILLIIRSIDALKDPFLGLGVDKLLQLKFTYKQIILLSLIPFVISYYYLFHPPQSIAIAVSLAIALFSLHFFDSLLNIAYLALGAVMTDQYHERTRITAYREGIKVVGVILAALLPAIFIQAQDDSKQLVDSFTLATYVLALLVAIGGLLFYRWSPQPLKRSPKTSDSTPLRIVFKQAVQYQPFRNLVTIYAFNSIAAAISATLVFFFIDHVLKASSYTFVFLAIYFLAAVFGMGVWTRLAKVRSKKFSWLVGMIVSIIAYSFAFWLTEGDIILYGFICFFSGLCLGSDVAIPPAIFADVIDRVDPNKKWHSGFFGVWNVTTKLSIAVAAGLALSLLGYAGFNENPGSGFSLTMLSAIYALIPCFFKILATIMLYCSSIDQEQKL
ncbi:MAG: MFS transporter [Alphaproteobacteria bacterium]|nr:MFS transporter [Alphaproteobacteria bacterium]